MSKKIDKKIKGMVILVLVIIVLIISIYIANKNKEKIVNVDWEKGGEGNSNIDANIIQVDGDSINFKELKPEDIQGKKIDEYYVIKADDVIEDLKTEGINIKIEGYDLDKKAVPYYFEIYNAPVAYETLSELEKNEISEMVIGGPKIEGTEEIVGIEEGILELMPGYNIYIVPRKYDENSEGYVSISKASW